MNTPAVVLVVLLSLFGCSQKKEENTSDDKKTPTPKGKGRVSAMKAPPASEESEEASEESEAAAEQPPEANTVSKFAAYPPLHNAANATPEKLTAFVKNAPMVKVPIATILKYLPTVGKEIWSIPAIKGNKTGYEVERWETKTIDGKLYLHCISISQIEYMRFGVISVEYYVTKSLYQAFGDGELVSIEKTGHTNKEKNTYTLTRMEKGIYKRVTKQNLLANTKQSETKEQILDLEPGSIMNSGLAVQVLIAKNRVKGTRSYRIRSYSFHKNLDTNGVIAVYSQQPVHLRGKKPEKVHVASMIGANPPSIVNMLIDMNGQVVQTEAGIYSSMVSTEKEALERFELFEYRSIMVTPTPIRGITKKTEEMSVTFRGNMPVGLKVFNTSRYSIKRRNNYEFTVTLKRDNLRGLRHLPTPPELREYLWSSPRLQLDDPLIVSLSKKAVGGARSNPEKVARLVTFVNRYIKGDLDYNLNTAVAVAKARRGDCTEHTLLFVALARAQKIPTRRVSGLKCRNTCRGCMFIGHAWAQVWLGRWIDVDPTWNQQSADVTHVLLSTDDDYRSVQLVGKLKYVSHKILK
ncbi:transglutaminase family protein [Myxococcota bacterium]|nr:transglutaminase family protein [Myxococcota bacterium]MBU1534913.1 transglutaminase family protein [Myxococcota bacterium]